jgi:hypothetical protein
MEARIGDSKDIPFVSMENENITKQDLREIKAAIDSLMMMIKHENSDIRKELSYLATKQEAAEIKYEIKESIKTLEMKLYAFIVKAVVTTLGIATAIQPLYNIVTHTK